jgi:hypothetical protein
MEPGNETPMSRLPAAMRLILPLLIGLLSVSVFAQSDFISKRGKINRTYDQLSAAYTVVADEDSETVYCKFSNQGRQPVVVVLSITKAGGGTSHRQVEVLAGSLASINIGNIASMSVSITDLKPGEDSQEKRVAERADIRDQITKEGDKLSAISFEKTAPKKDAALKKDDPSKQTKLILELIFGNNSTAGMTFTDEDTKIAEYFLKELVEGSCRMSLAEVVFKTAYSFDPDIQDIVFDLIEAYGDNCGKDAKKAKYYQTVIDTIKGKYRTAFDNRKQNGEWLMTFK